MQCSLSTFDPAAPISSSAAPHLVQAVPAVMVFVVASILPMIVSCASLFQGAPEGQGEFVRSRMEQSVREEHEELHSKVQKLLSSGTNRLATLRLKLKLAAEDMPSFDIERIVSAIDGHEYFENDQSLHWREDAAEEILYVHFAGILRKGEPNSWKVN